jgi:uncharacterized protein
VIFSGQGVGSLLDAAVSKSDVDLLKYLLKHGADPNVKTRPSGNPLHIAAGAGNSTIVRLLLDNGAVVDARDKDNSTPLFLAVIGENDSNVKLLLERGADPLAMNLDCSCAYTAAIKRGSYEIADLIKSKNPDIEQSVQKAMAGCAPREHEDYPAVEPKGTDDQTNSGHFVGSVALKVTYPGSEIIEAVDKGDMARIKELLTKKPSMVNAQTPRGESPLIRALERRQKDIDLYKLLIEQGADVKLADAQNISPLQYAAELGSVEVAQLLLDHGAEVNAKDDGGMTPIFNVAASGNVELAKLLIDRGADLTTRNTRGLSPLGYALECKRTELADFLRKQGGFE